MIVYKFIEGRVHHLDGAVYQGKIIFFQPSSHIISNPFDFLHGQPLGSIMINDVQEKEKWLEFANEVNLALEFPDGVFHIEAIKSHDGGRYFIEVGVRPGGGYIVPNIEKHTGINLEKLHVLLQVKGNPFLILKNAKNLSIGGFLNFPRSFSNSDSIVTQIKLPNFNDLKTLTHSTHVPRIGDRVSGDFSYIETLGNFFFSSSDYSAIEADMNRISENYKVYTQPISKITNEL